MTYLLKWSFPPYRKRSTVWVKTKLVTSLLPANEVWGKVIFSQASVILLTGGSVRETPHQGDPPAKETPPPGRPPSKETPLPGRPPLQAHTQGGNWGGSGPGPQPRGKLRGIRSRHTPKGEIEGDQIQAHTQGGNWGGSDPGPHQRGKFSGIRTRPPPPNDYCYGRYASYWNAFLSGDSVGFSSVLRWRITSYLLHAIWKENPVA